MSHPDLDRHPVAVVTGGGAGIGEAIAAALARDGHRVSVADIDAEGATRVAESLAALDGSRPGVAYCVDVRDPNALEEMMVAIAATGDGIDIVCPNAAVAFPASPLHETSLDVIQRLLSVNLEGAILTARAAIPHLRPGGSIIFTGSLSGLVSRPGAAVYGAAKIGVIGLARSLAGELAAAGIRVNVVCPGSTDTPLVRSLFSNEEIDAVAVAHPLGRIATPADVANAVAFLASAAARHISGVALRVDGGSSVTGVL